MEHKKRAKVSLGDGNIPSSMEKREDRYSSHEHGHGLKPHSKSHLHETLHHSGNGRQNQVGTVMLFGVPIVSLVMEGKERLCLAQISSTLLKEFSYNEIHNRRVALGITCIQCTPVQLEILRRAGAMPVTSRRCGMITRREAERLCQSFLGDHAPPQLPENFAFNVYHECAWGCRGAFVPARYNSSRAKCIRCSFCQLFFSPNKFIFHSHRLPDSHYVQPDAANFNSWRRHLKLCGDSADDATGVSSSSYRTATTIISPDGKDGVPPIKESFMVTAQIVHAWEDVKAMFNGGTRKRLLAAQCTPASSAGNLIKHSHSVTSKVNQGGGGSGQGHGHGHGSSSRAATPQSSRQQQQQQQHFLNHTAGISSCSPIASTPPAFMSPVLQVNSPLLSPGGIWNPGLSPPRVGNCTQIVPPMPLSLHPLSIPWLRRPLFPFSHPFGPTCKFLGGGEGPGAMCGGESCGVNSSSAFKPVSVGSVASANRNQSVSSATAAEHIFSTWLNNSVNMSTTAIAANNSNLITAAAALPEDLSVNSSVGTCTSTPTRMSPSVDSTERSASRKNFKELSNSSTCKITTTTASTTSPESSDEENVDIESTETTESDKREEQFEENHNTTSQSHEAHFNSSARPAWHNRVIPTQQQTILQTDKEDDDECDDEEVVDVLEESGDDDGRNSPVMSPAHPPCQSHNHSNGGSTRKLLASSSSGSTIGKRPKKRLWDFDRRDD